MNKQKSYPCHLCAKFYKDEINTSTCKHKHPTTTTPPDFWRTDFPDSPEIKSRGMMLNDEDPLPPQAIHMQWDIDDSTDKCGKSDEHSTSKGGSSDQTNTDVSISPPAKRLFHGIDNNDIPQKDATCLVADTSNSFTESESPNKVTKSTNIVIESPNMAIDIPNDEGTNQIDNTSINTNLQNKNTNLENIRLDNSQDVPIEITTPTETTNMAAAYETEDSYFNDSMIPAAASQASDVVVHFDEDKYKQKQSETNNEGESIIFDCYFEGDTLFIVEEKNKQIEASKTGKSAKKKIGKQKIKNKDKNIKQAVDLTESSNAPQLRSKKRKHPGSASSMQTDFSKGAQAYPGFTSSRKKQKNEGENIIVLSDDESESIVLLSSDEENGESNQFNLGNVSPFAKYPQHPSERNKLQLQVSSSPSKVQVSSPSNVQAHTEAIDDESPSDSDNLNELNAQNVHVNNETDTVENIATAQQNISQTNTINGELAKSDKIMNLKVTKDKIESLNNKAKESKNVNLDVNEDVNLDVNEEEEAANVSNEKESSDNQGHHSEELFDVVHSNKKADKINERCEGEVKSNELNKDTSKESISLKPMSDESGSDSSFDPLSAMLDIMEKESVLSSKSDTHPNHRDEDHIDDKMSSDEIEDRSKEDLIKDKNVEEKSNSMESLSRSKNNESTSSESSSSKDDPLSVLINVYNQGSPVSSEPSTTKPITETTEVAKPITKTTEVTRPITKTTELIRPIDYNVLETNSKLNERKIDHEKRNENKLSNSDSNLPEKSVIHEKQNEKNIAKVAKKPIEKSNLIIEEKNPNGLDKNSKSPDKNSNDHLNSVIETNDNIAHKEVASEVKTRRTIDSRVPTEYLLKQNKKKIYPVISTLGKKVNELIPSDKSEIQDDRKIEDFSEIIEKDKNFVNILHQVRSKQSNKTSAKSEFKDITKTSAKPEFKDVTKTSKPEFKDITAVKKVHKKHHSSHLVMGTASFLNAMLSSEKKSKTVENQTNDNNAMETENECNKKTSANKNDVKDTENQLENQNADCNANKNIVERNKDQILKPYTNIKEKDIPKTDPKHSSDADNSLVAHGGKHLLFDTSTVEETTDIVALVDKLPDEVVVTLDASINQSFVAYNNLDSPTCIAGSIVEYQTSYENYLRACLWSPDGSTVLTNSNDNILRLFTLPDNIMEKDLYEELSPALRMSEGETVYDIGWYPYMNIMNPDTCCFLSTSRDHPVHLWDSTKGKVRCSYRAFDQMDELTSANCVSFNLDGSKIYCGFNKKIRIFDSSRPGRECTEISTVAPKNRSRKGRGPRSAFHQSGIISCIDFSTQYDGLYALGSYNKTVGLYASNTDKALFMLTGHQGGITQVKFTYDGYYLLTGGRKDPEIQCWDLRDTTRPLFKMLRNVLTNQTIQFDIDRYGSYVASGDTNNNINVWDLNDIFKLVQDDVISYTPKHQFVAHGDAVNAVSIHPTLPLFASTSGQRHFIVDDSDSDSMETEIPVCRRYGIENCLKLWKV